MRAKTNVVVITFDALSYTRATLESLFNKTRTPYLLTIVDNGSTDGSIEYLENLVTPEFCEKYVFIRNDRNAGVGYAYNQGQQVSFIEEVEYTAFCNNDLYFSHNWLSKLESRLDENPNVAMLSPLRPSAKVMYDENITTRDRLMLIPETDDWHKELIEYTGLPIINFDKFCQKISKANNESEIELISFPDSLSTCVCMTRNKSFKSLNKFADERFVGYGGEDIDMSWTIMSMGYNCAIDHSVYVHHFRGKSLKANNLDRQKLLKKSNKILYAKWCDHIHPFIVNRRDEGVDIVHLIRNGQCSEYWLLHELSKDVEFLEAYANV